MTQGKSFSNRTTWRCRKGGRNSPPKWSSPSISTASKARPSGRLPCVSSSTASAARPVFENYGAYSLACIVIDPNNPFVVWAGTGENNHQRALGYGDGVYKSVDGGKSLKNK